MSSLFNLHKNHYIYIIGGGGKTTLMYQLAHQLADDGHSVITTTSTKIMYPSEDECGEVVLWGRCVAGSRGPGVEKGKHVTLVKSVDHEMKDKIVGFLAEELDEIYEQGAADYVIVEADGSRGRSIKAHADYEPVISKKADLLIVVIGADCIGKEISEETVHRVDLFCERVGKKQGDVITFDDVSKILFHEKGYLKDVGSDTEVLVYLRQVGEEGVGSVGLGA